jgi:transcriptional antiterminator NusG
MLFYRKIGLLPADRRAIWPDAPDLDESVPVEDRKPTDVSIGDHVRVIAGHFQNFEGDVDTIDHEKGRVTIRVAIFGRSTAVELQSWQVQRIGA